MANVAWTTTNHAPFGGNGAFSTSDARLVDDPIDRHTAYAAVAITAGQVIRLDSAGKWVLAAATTAPNGTGCYIALRAAGVNQGLTGMRAGKMAGLDPTVAPPTAIYLSDTPGTLANTAGTVSIQLGRVLEAGIVNFVCPL
jgi:hypothetical protein